MTRTVTCNSRPSCRVALAVLFVFIASMSGPAASAELALHEAEVEWSDRDEADRANAFRRALRQVLIKVTGLRRFADTAQFESLVENAQGLVQQYQLGTVTVAYGETEVQEPRLWARFDEDAVERLVREAGLPVWSGTRPPVLVWIAAENDGTLLAVGSEGSERVTEILQRGAASRGVSLVLPLLDLEDLAQAGPPEFWVEAEERVRAASERYQPAGILIGRVAGGVLWEADWSLLLGGAVQRWKTEGDVFDLVVDEGVQEAIDMLAAHHVDSAHGKEEASVVVSVSGVHDFRGYARTMRYLESMDEVESIDVLAVVSGRLRLGLKLRTGVAGLHDLFALGATLAEDGGDVDGALAFRLLP